MTSADAIDRFAERERDRILDELTELLTIPSISTDPAHAADCRRAADWLDAHLRELGCTTEQLASETHPVLLATGPEVEGAPTVLVYGHYDVQPPDPLEEWESPPFEPAVRNGNLYARGATDDKGQVFSLIKAFEAVAARGRPPVNVRFLLEGQEESGSKVLFRLLRERPDLVRADAVLVSDMPYYAPGWPAVETGLRGLCYAEITVRTLATDLHSGLYGGVAPNAHETLVRILAGLKAANGRIRIPGLYEAVERPSRAERDAWKRLPFSETKFRRGEVGAKALTGLPGRSVLERLWALPTLEIHGIRGGFTGEGAKTVIPAEAKAKLSLRLVPKQKEKTVQGQLTKAVKALAPTYADVRIEFIHGADPVLIDAESRAVRLMQEVFADVERRAAVPIRSGGSIPIVPELAKEGAEVVLTGIGLPDDRLHAPNEKIGIAQIEKGVRVFGRFLQALSDGT